MLLVVLFSTDAAAQLRRPDRGWIAVNVGLQTAPSGLSDHFEFERNLETATTDVDYQKGSG
jgi:hypothetical protein